MRPLITTRSLLAAIEAKRRDEAAKRWALFFPTRRRRADADAEPTEARATDR